MSKKESLLKRFLLSFKGNGCYYPELEKRIGNVLIRENTQIVDLYRGNVILDTNKTLEVYGSIEGNIFANKNSKLIIKGKIVGKINSDNLVLKGNAKIDGEVHYTRLVMESNVLIKGEMVVISNFSEDMTFEELERL